MTSEDQATMHLFRAARAALLARGLLCAACAEALAEVCTPDWPAPPAPAPRNLLEARDAKLAQLRAEGLDV